MTKFYTSVEIWGGRILYRAIEDGRRVRHKVDYHPTLFVQSRQPTEYTTIYGEYMSPIKPGTIKETRDFVKQYDGVENFDVYGNQRYQYCFIADEFPNTVDWDMTQIKVANIDIEVGSENGFPEPDTASEPLTAITVKMGGVYTVFGCGEWANLTGRENIVYFKCADEIDLINKFLGWWQSDYPDAITGWNVEAFDVPYLVNRIRNVMGDKRVIQLSPWNVVSPRLADVGMKKVGSYAILGVPILDYLKLYRWYAPEGRSQESYKLDNIAHVELGERKLSYEEYGSLHNLYKEDYQKFIDYNIKDVELVDRLEEKHKLIELALTLSYDNKCNYEDVFTQVRMWDIICFNHLKKKKIVVPPLVSHEKDAAYVGAYVKDPIVGFHNWVASFDVNSEYPSVIMGSNISPETIVEPGDLTEGMRRILANNVSVDRLLERQIVLDSLVDENVCLTANGQFYRRDKQGFMPEMVEKMFADRKVYKKRMIDAETSYENETDPAKKAELKKEIAKYKNLQLSKKVSLNSLYGALGSQYFRFFDIRHAIAVTTTGQLSIRWIERSLNGYLRKLLKTKDDYVIAVDTDSVYLHLDGLVVASLGSAPETAKAITFMDKACETYLQPVIDRACQSLGDYTNVYRQKIVMKREVLADKAIWTAKKRYILNVYNNEGVQYNEPQMKVMGLEMVKSSTPSAIREKMKDTILLMLRGTEEDVQNFIENFRKEFKTLPPEEISFPRGLNGLKEYSDSVMMYKKGTPIHVKGAILYNHYLKQKGLTKQYPLIQEGEKLKFTYLKQPNPFKDTVISYPVRLPKEFGLHDFIDYDMQFDKAYLEPVKIILGCIGWNHEKVSSLDGFFA